MIVITKKRIKIIISSVLIALFAFSFQIASRTEENNSKQEIQKQNTIETTATPVSGKTIVIDAGHGVPEKGSYLLTQIK